MNVITGLPRSGSTLLCNILNQNPRFHASSTSLLPQIVGGIIKTWSDAPETRGALVLNESGANTRMHLALKGLCDGWYAKQIKKKKVIFDKSRSWAHQLMALRAIYPESKVLVMVRDLRDVFASVEKQHRRSPLLDQGGAPGERTVWGRADRMFRTDGMIGAPVEGVLDLMRRQLKTTVIRYETFVERPKAVMQKVYQYLEEDGFEHDFDDVQNTAEDLDALYLNKYPHKGDGKVQPGDPEPWQQMFTPDLAGQIMGRFSAYNKAFGYS